MLRIDKGTLADIDEIMDIYAIARDFMRRSGNPNQWGNSRPSRETILTDIRDGHSYCVIDDGRIVGHFFFDVCEEPTYKVINGQWLNDEPYGVIHRIASNGTSKGVLEAALKMCFKKVGNIRIDTHHDNKVMQHLLMKYGFTRCGIIHLADGDPRIAYQKIEVKNDI